MDILFVNTIKVVKRKNLMADWYTWPAIRGPPPAAAAGSFGLHARLYGPAGAMGTGGYLRTSPPASFARSEMRPRRLVCLSCPTTEPVFLKPSVASSLLPPLPWWWGPRKDLWVCSRAGITEKRLPGWSCQEHMLVSKIKQYKSKYTQPVQWQREWLIKSDMVPLIALLLG